MGKKKTAWDKWTTNNGINKKTAKDMEKLGVRRLIRRKIPQVIIVVEKYRGKVE